LFIGYFTSKLKLVLLVILIFIIKDLLVKLLIVIGTIVFKLNKFRF
jgi:hypothetical protein